jgi:flagellin-like hook-associated protein FlgL
MDIAAMRRALDHAAWRDPGAEKRRTDDVLKAVHTLERTAACVDLALERINEARDTLAQGKATREQVMRGLLTARLEELLDSLERIAIMAQDGGVNLLAGNGEPVATSPSKFSPMRFQNSLSVDIGTAGFRYVLTPIDIRRGGGALDIPVLESGFEDDRETYEVETALIRASTKLAQFGDRLSHDAAMLVRIAQEHPLPEKAEAPKTDEVDAA